MITASAIKFFHEDDKDHRFPQIWTGLRHANILERMFNMGVKYDKDTCVQGFITETNEFMDRYEALSHAYSYDQIDSETFYSMKQLYSEDIWPEDE